MTQPDAKARSSTSRRWSIVALAGMVILVAAAGSGCYLEKAIGPTPSKDEPLMRLQTPGSAWWVGGGSHAVLQAVGEDGRPLVVVWNRASGKTRTYPHYRVVDVEPHAPRFWIVPDARPVPLGVNRDTARPRVIDIAGDGIDSRPPELYVVRLDEDGRPRSDVDARWDGWDGIAGYSATVEIDVNKGACPSTLRFYAAGGSLNAWSAKVPTDVVTFEPIGWSPSGRYFAVITQADESATVSAVAAWNSAYKAAAPSESANGVKALPAPPTWGADVLVFAAVDGSLAARQKVTAPMLQPNAGSSLAGWAGAGDTLYYLDGAGGVPILSALTPGVQLDASDPFARAWSADPPRYAWVAGVDGDDLMVSCPSSAEDTDGESGSIDVWILKPEGAPVSLGRAKGDVTARWSPKGGMLSLEAYGPKELAWVVYRSQAAGGVPAMVFATPGPTDPVWDD